MANSIVEHVSVETNGSLSVEQKAQLIRERVEAMLSKASLQQVAERMPKNKIFPLTGSPSIFMVERRGQMRILTMALVLWMGRSQSFLPSTQIK